MQEDEIEGQKKGERGCFEEIFLLKTLENALLKNARDALSRLSS